LPSLLADLPICRIIMDASCSLALAPSTDGNLEFCFLPSFVGPFFLERKFNRVSSMSSATKVGRAWLCSGGYFLFALAPDRVWSYLAERIEIMLSSFFFSIFSLWILWRAYLFFILFLSFTFVSID